MCNEKCKCQKKSSGKKNAKCSPEQIIECHGDVKDHPCHEEPKTSGGDK